ncbi:probable E3 SUMO-protein ligase RNF212 isoform X2 [Perca fluviatilis]|uniref:probable E3 SUMO-protein ligase RNF212 isoform X2 n=1 Tax=Perca fluviatilis TaxID=8168 RepID=UPI001966C5FC|nr:probable E3 SUMO-protein ligase RNF212 isoform X2 [Perca fluviatilis]
MAYWICCNSCFLSLSAERKLAVTTCGHIICSICYQKGKPGQCLICNTKCQISPLTDKLRGEGPVLRHQCCGNQTLHGNQQSSNVPGKTSKETVDLLPAKGNEKLEDVLVKMKQEMQQMAKKLNEQSAYIAKLENSFQQQSAKVSSGPQMSHSSHTPHGHKSVLQIQYTSPMSLSRHSSATNITENMELDERSLFRKPNTVPRLSLISPPQDGRMGTIPHRSSNQNMLANHSARSATVSRFQGSPVTPDISYDQSSGWKSPIFKPLSSFRHSMSSLVCPPP